ncbi:general alpha-glucoside permease [Colletotrichum orchidophilum]|uniref:General alpha-glucoside permease n=1 Tax=Colletotrichum orchidophilum TaxID=1209926 RepID=A0A1G4B778_9PEZI|nr:general alpha-glucoside permease [Colletotrichum orchidophilum]OHE97125.1 general alpha-glucoside permease [Colletotrichum orchidophilum]
MAAPIDEPCLSRAENLPSEEHERLLSERDELGDPKPPEQLSTPGLLLLTCPSLGLQVSWFLLQSSGTPYLGSLGMTPSSISLTWALGPIFGAFLQPIIGQLSDELDHPLGRRKPVMIAGALTTVIPTLLMACAPELTAPFTENPAANPWQPRALAVACLVIILLAINAYSVGVRAIVVDACPPSQQPAAAAWSMRWNVLGSAALSTAGFVYTTQSSETDPVVAFRTLACVAAICSATTVGLVCWLVPRDATPPLRLSGSGSEIGRVWAMCLPGELVRRWRRLPPLTGRVCGVQLFGWFGWFPVLFYMSTYAYETALSESLQASNLEPSPAETHAKPYPLYASLSFSLGTLLSTVLLSCLSRIHTVLNPRNLPRLWLVSQLLATTSLLLTIPFQTSTVSLILLSLIGATWAVTMWIPFALINTELAHVRTGVAGVQGLHNMAISLPQVASALVCAAVLAGLDSVGVGRGAVWLMRLAAVPVAWSTWLIWRLDAKELVGVY